MKFIAQKISGGKNQRKLSLYCRVLQVSRQGFYDYLQRRNRPWKYGPLAEEMRQILSEDKENDTYGRKRMYEALRLRNPEGVAGSLPIPSERTVYRIMKELGISHRPRRKPNGITKADRAARKSDDLLCRNFRADAPLRKCISVPCFWLEAVTNGWGGGYEHVQRMRGHERSASQSLLDWKGK